jgi:hypothetical protein
MARQPFKTTVMFHAVWNNEPTVFTEYVYTSDRTDAAALKAGIYAAAKRLATQSKQVTVQYIQKELEKTATLQTALDGWMNMSTKNKIQKRRIPGSELGCLRRLKETAARTLPELEPDVIQAFLGLANAQRGLPESALLAFNHFYAGVASPVFEHTGDLTHRMTEGADWDYSGLSHVKDNCEKVLRYLRSSYGFAREFRENVEHNATYKKMDVDEYCRKLDSLAERYAKEHFKLPVYNRPQWLARQAAVLVGMYKWAMAASKLQELYSLAQNEEKYLQEAYTVTRDSAGRITQYKP